MDEGLSRAVTEFFVRLYEKGLIYRGNRMVNWCPVCGTSLSDTEVEHEDERGKYWYFRYPFAEGGAEAGDAEDAAGSVSNNGGAGGIVVATSRPETMFGDTGVAVNPSDERYRHLIGRKVLLPIVGREIPIVADPYPDPEKGTGAVKITPAHDMNDFEVGQRQGLETVVCIDTEAKMTEAAGKYKGLDRYECRKAWVAELEAGGYLVKTEDVVIPTGKCYRCEKAVEPMLSEQWFVKMRPLAEPAIRALESGELNFVPERYGKIYLHWMEEIRDWCVSRQLWWGHRIPAWYCGDCGETIVAKETPAACPHCGAPGGEGGKLRQDEDVLDTWFSSALWPFSTLGWPDDTADLKYFYPTSVLVTAYDIIFFWVARMAFSGIECMGESPFRHVFIHGLVRGADGRKMSKTLGNGVDPLEMIDRYGADALRFNLLHGSAAGNDMRWSEEDMVSARNFANKLWNAARFVLMNLGNTTTTGTKARTLDDFPSLAPTFASGGQVLDPAELRDEDRWILALTERTAAGITEALEKFELSVAIEKIYELIRDEYCDWYIEFVKARLYGDDEDSKATARAVLEQVLSDLLRLLHPFMPFITEEIWGYLGKPSKLIKDVWPAPRGFAEDPEFTAASEKIEITKDIIRAVRNIRAEAGAEPSQKFPIIIKVDAETIGGTIGTAPIVSSIASGLREDIGEAVMRLAGVSEVRVTTDETDVPQDAASAILSGLTVYVPTEELINYEAERKKLKKELERLEPEVPRLRAKLENEGFLAKAPAQVVATERGKLADAEEALAKTRDRLAFIQEKLREEK